MTVERLHEVHGHLTRVEPLDIERGVEMTTAPIFFHGVTGTPARSRLAVRPVTAQASGRSDQPSSPELTGPYRR